MAMFIKKWQHVTAAKDAILFNTQDTDYYNIHYVLARNAEANMVKTPVYTMVLGLRQTIIFNSLAHRPIRLIFGTNTVVFNPF